MTQIIDRMRSVHETRRTGRQNIYKSIYIMGRNRPFEISFWPKFPPKPKNDFNENYSQKQTFK